MAWPDPIQAINQKTGRRVQIISLVSRSKLKTFLRIIWRWADEEHKDELERDWMVYIYIAWKGDNPRYSEIKLCSYSTGYASEGV